MKQETFRHLFAAKLTVAALLSPLMAGTVVWAAAPKAAKVPAAVDEAAHVEAEEDATVAAAKDKAGTGKKRAGTAADPAEKEPTPGPAGVNDADDETIPAEEPADPAAAEEPVPGPAGVADPADEAVPADESADPSAEPVDPAAEEETVPGPAGVADPVDESAPDAADLERTDKDMPADEADPATDDKADAHGDKAHADGDKADAHVDKAHADGDKAHADGDKAHADDDQSLYERLGGEPAIKLVVDGFVARAAANPKVNFVRKGHPGVWDPTPKNIAKLKKHLVTFIGSATGGPQKYEGRDMVTAHVGQMITEAEFNALAGDLIATLEEAKVPKKEIDELVTIVASTKGDIVGK